MKMITAENAGVKLNGKTILDNISFVLPEGHSMAIVGPSGSGKTTLGKLIGGLAGVTSGQLKVANDKLCLMVEQQDNFMAASHIRSGYYGQRYENLGLEDVPTVGEYLKKIAQSLKSGISRADIDSSLLGMGILALSGRKLMYLSDGERKRTQLVATLIQNPDILVLDQPFVGLDVSAREILEGQLAWFQKSGRTLVLICDPGHVPSQIDWVLELGRGVSPSLKPRKEFVPEKPEMDKTEDLNNIFGFFQPAGPDRFEHAVVMKNVNVSFRGNNILKNINWEVRKGDRWALLGPNGSGKTTLLSLITADNPQGYCNDLVLFDRKRGSGETIWDIKKRIGFVSPELHLFFLGGKGIFNSIPGLENSPGYIGNSVSCEEVVSSGFQDQVGFSDNNSNVQKKSVDAWLSVFQIDHLSGKTFREASMSEQRLLLLARALVKMPSLLILDEPCQGLGPHQTVQFTEMLDVVCPKLDTTMIYVTHQPEEIPKSVNKLLRLEAGSIKSCGEFPEKV